MTASDISRRIREICDLSVGMEVRLLMGLIIEI
jgi:hypothetical protein